MMDELKILKIPSVSCLLLTNSFIPETFVILKSIDPGKSNSAFFNKKKGENKKLTV